MEKHIITAICLGLLSASMAGARELTPSEALDRALPSLKLSSASGRSAEAHELISTIRSEGHPAVYIFSTDATGGYLILPASDAVGTTVLGYSEQGKLVPDAMPDNMAWWLDVYARQIAAAEAGSDSGDVDVPPGAYPIGKPEIAPLVKTTWNQTAPYNEMCPEANGEHCPTGCVASAMAQVMKVWNYPATGSGSNTYYPSATIGEDISLDFSTVTFEWDAMKNSYASSETGAAVDAVAELMYSCGVAVNMNYAPNQSASNYTLALNALYKYFNYDKGMRELARNYFELEQWNELIYNELSQGRPVLYGGSNENGGHAFVCDGYRPDGYFHFNWGWGGNGDGYFIVTDLYPQYAGVGASLGGYNLNQTIIVGIQPPVSGSEFLPVMEFMSDFTIQDPSYARKQGVAVEMYDMRGIYNMSLSNIDMIMGLKLTDETGTVTYIPGSETLNMVKGEGIRSYPLDAGNFPSEGTYTVSPVVKVEGSQTWHDAYVKMANVREYTLTATTDSLLFAPVDEATVSQHGLAIETSLDPGKYCVISATLTNSGDEEYYRNISPVLVKGNVQVAEAEALAIDLGPESSSEYEWITYFSSGVAPGAYTLYLVDNSGKRIGSGIAVTVKEAPAEAGKAVVTGVTIGGKNAFANSVQAPTLTDLSHFVTTMTVEGTQGYFGEIVNGAVWYDATRGVIGLGGRFVGLDPGQKADITVEHDLSSLEPDHVYYLYVKGQVSGALGDPVYFKADPAAGIVQVDAPEKITAYSDGTTLHVGAPDPVMSVEIYTFGGVRVAEGSNAYMDISRLAPGIYAVKVSTTTATSTVKLRK